MRDPKRIRRICAKLATAWEIAPDQRLGQLLDNIIGGSEPWNVEDDKWEEAIDHWIQG